LSCGGHGHTEDAVDGSDAAIEGQFTGDDVIAHFITGDFVPAGKDAQSDGQIESRAGFFDIGWGKIDEGKCFRITEARICDGAANTFDAFFDGGIGQADNHRFFEAIQRNIDFNFTENPLDAFQGH